MKWDHLRKCADQTEVQFLEYYSALKRTWLKHVREGCTCEKHCSEAIQHAMENKDSFLNWLLCEKEIRQDLPRTPSIPIYTAARHSEDTDANLAYLNKKYKTESGMTQKIAREVKKETLCVKSRHDTNRQSVQSEVLTIHKRECCLSLCQNCGINRRLTGMDLCPLESSAHITYKKYQKGFYVNRH